jgi:DNA-binding transcriptional LysR family regulator
VSRIGELEAFVCVVDSGSFSAAARTLGVSKSHISKTIGRLEERLGARLLNRTTRRLSLTDVGTAFHARGHAVLAELDEAERSVTNLQTEPRGTLRITAPLTFGIRYLTPVVTEFMRKNPKLRVELNLDDRVVDLLAEGYDLAVRVGQSLEDSSLIARKVSHMCLHVVGSRAYLDGAARPETPEDLRGHPCMRYTYSATGDSWRLVHDDGTEASVRIDGPLQANNGDVSVRAVEAGLGLAYLPDFVAYEAVRDGLLEVVLRDWRGQGGVWAVYPHNRHLSAKVRLFIDAMAAAFGHAPWSLGLCGPNS